MKSQKGLFILVLFLFSQMVFAYPITGNAIETGKTTISAGVTPDSFLYFLDVALDNINLALTFDPEEKARKALDIAKERLMEVRKMTKVGKMDALQIAQREHANALSVVQDSIKMIEKANYTEEIEKEIEIEKELEEHKTEVEEVVGELKIKIEVEGKITPDQQALIDSVLAKLEGKVKEVEIEIENEQSETKIKIQKQTDKSEEDIEEEIEELEERVGLKEIRKEKAWDKIKDIEEITKELNVTGKNMTSVLNILAEAKEAYITKDYKKAIKLAKQAEKQVEGVEKEEKEIEVEIKGNRTKVSIKVGKIKAKFVLATTNKGEIISEIARRTGLSLSEIESIMEIEVEEEMEIEAEIEEGTAKIKVEINKTKTEFTLNTTDKEEIISKIVKRTGLNREDVEKSVEFEIEREEEADVEIKIRKAPKKLKTITKKGETEEDEKL